MTRPKTYQRLNLHIYSRNYTDAIAALLGLLRKGPRLATTFAHWSTDCPVNALIEAEAQGLCSAERISFTRASNQKSEWLWTITPRGKLWLIEHGKTRRAA
jgi:hypothetical protein